jgi:hypothetical protein
VALDRLLGHEQRLRRLAGNADWEFLVAGWVFGVESAPNVRFGAPAGRAMIVLFSWPVIRQAPGE